MKYIVMFVILLSLVVPVSVSAQSNDQIVLVESENGVWLAAMPSQIGFDIIIFDDEKPQTEIFAYEIQCDGDEGFKILKPEVSPLGKNEDITAIQNAYEKTGKTQDIDRNLSFQSYIAVVVNGPNGKPTPLTQEGVIFGSIKFGEWTDLSCRVQYIDSTNKLYEVFFSITLE